MSIYELIAYSVLYVFLVFVLAMRFVDEDLKQARQFFQKHWKDVSDLNEKTPYYAYRTKLTYDLHTLASFVGGMMLVYITLTYSESLPFVIAAFLASIVYNYVLSKTETGVKPLLLNTDAATHHYISCYTRYLYDYQLIKRQAAMK